MTPPSEDEYAFRKAVDNSYEFQNFMLAKVSQCVFLYGGNTAKVSEAWYTNAEETRIVREFRSRIRYDRRELR